MQVFESENRFGSGVVKSWASDLETNTREQAEAVSRAQHVEGHVALMPDAHFGFGPPVGSVIVTRGGVMPYSVGVDIGCGMIAVQTDLRRSALSGEEGHIIGQLRTRIPSGIGKGHPTPTSAAIDFFDEHGEPPGIMPDSRLVDKQGLLAVQRISLRDRAKSQFGTLGAGNHFVEVCEDRAGMVWLLLHSGSRGIGNILATAHVRVARDWCRDNGIELEHQDFAYVVAGSRQYREYLADMHWAQAYALANREAMMDELKRAVYEVTGPSWQELQRINCHHNYAVERDDGSILTRKGAISAANGKWGIIPSNMGGKTHIVVGLGNEEAYWSSAHGAGRTMSRREARETIDIEVFKKQMEGKTWLDRDAAQLLDEAPDAYKDIEQVMKDSRELVSTMHTIGQFINYKGVK